MNRRKSEDLGDPTGHCDAKRSRMTAPSCPTCPALTEQVYSLSVAIMAQRIPDSFFQDFCLLPPEVMLNVWSFLPPSDVVNIRRTCSKWNRLMLYGVDKMQRWRLDDALVIERAPGPGNRMVRLKYGLEGQKPAKRGFRKRIPVTELVQHLRFVTLDGHNDGTLWMELARSNAVAIIEALCDSAVILRPSWIVFTGDLSDVPADLLVRLLENMDIDDECGEHFLQFLNVRLGEKTIDGRIFHHPWHGFMLTLIDGTQCTGIDDAVLWDALYTGEIVIHNCPAITLNGLRQFIEKWLEEARTCVMYDTLVLRNCKQLDLDSIRTMCLNMVLQSSAFDIEQYQICVDVKVGRGSTLTISTFAEFRTWYGAVTKPRFVRPKSGSG